MIGWPTVIKYCNNDVLRERQRDFPALQRQGVLQLQSACR